MAKKSDLVSAVQDVLEGKDFKINQKQTTQVVDAVLDSIIGLTGEAGKLQLIGFGNFEVRERSARKGRNPQTGEEIEIAASKNTAFKAGKQFKDFIK
ncbi:HU family DNA-binding protein [Rossellomorea marisflavi]|uniref:HU family DNA-binding protein n=1 Tax=Rossellomorea marisflavi TaxID=189381 RepID=A0A5D4RYL1_9BACI|nr:HU family DNA-binding protein [Rossellomorea marisflavi]TYS56427.1 HU family DNA-binding protein [Rossellomorea marisflavi]